MKEVKLPSGAVLQLQAARFEQSKELFHACLEEFKGLQIQGEMQMDHDFLKNVFCQGFSSKKIERALNSCMEHALYNKVRISSDTFEPEAAREDYLIVCFEVAQENIRPFTKSLYAQLKEKILELQKHLA